MSKILFFRHAILPKVETCKGDMKSMEIKRIIVNSGSNTTLVTESMEIAYSSVFLKVIINIHNPIFIST